MFEQNKNNRYICIYNINRLTQTIYQHQMFFCMTKLIQKCRVAQQGGHWGTLHLWAAAQPERRWPACANKVRI